MKSLWTWTPLLFAVAFAIFAAGPWLQVPDDPGQSQALMGVEAAALATVMALVLTIVLVATQLSSRYSHQMQERVFTLPTLALLFGFVSLIAYSLALLSGLHLWSYSDRGFTAQVKIGYIAAVVILILLLPYLHWLMTERLNPEAAMSEEKEKASRKVRALGQSTPRDTAGTWIEYLPEVRSIDNILMASLALRDYQTLRRGISELVDLAVEAYACHQPAIGSRLLDRVGDIGVIALDDPGVFPFVIDVIGKAGLQALVSDPPALDAVERTSTTLRLWGLRVANRDLGERALSAVEYLGRTSVDAARLGFDSECWYAVQQLSELGAHAVGAQLEDCGMMACLYLSSAGREAVVRRLENSIEEASLGLRSLAERSMGAGNRGIAVQAVKGICDMGVSGESVADRGARRKLMGPVMRHLLGLNQDHGGLVEAALSDLPTTSDVAHSEQQRKFSLRFRQAAGAATRR